MGYFDDCRLDQRFTLAPGSPRRTGNPTRKGLHWVVNDWDQRRTITVCTSWEEDDEDFIFEALAEHIDDLPADAVFIEISRDGGELLSYSSDGRDDPAMVTFYPSVADFTQELRRVRRSDLTEIDRLGLQVDLTTYESPPGQIKRVAFKYYSNPENIAMVWHELNCMIRIPKHPNIVPFDSLVVDTVDGDDKVVGFTTDFIPGGTVEDNVSRVFKLKYLKQLIKVVDYLNLRLGIVHGDICFWNLLINFETDDLQIFDFNMAAKLGWEGDMENGGTFAYDADRNDVKLTVFTIYEIITRDLHFREDYYPIKSDYSAVLEMDAWEQHSEVRLDSPMSDYRQELEEWVKTRKEAENEITHYTQAPDAIDWPPLPEFPLVPFAGNMKRRPSQRRQEMIKRGADFLKWQRPASSELPLPRGKRLLATGEVVHDDGGGEDAVDIVEVRGDAGDFTGKGED
ncbi:hypothetical protein BDZ45DRAFT_756235 [Acephala macrosclerotiorum]|nr:hypothetical protein BDZ45DRAFT_756235 [Acephala macrosclerotiorum]